MVAQGHLNWEPGRQLLCLSWKKVQDRVPTNCLNFCHFLGPRWLGVLCWVERVLWLRTLNPFIAPFLPKALTGIAPTLSAILTLKIMLQWEVWLVP